MSEELESCGEFRIVLQQFKHMDHTLICGVKIYPRVLTLYKKDSVMDYNWFTPQHWTKIESELWRLCDDIQPPWDKNSTKLETEFFIDNGVRVRSRLTQTLLSPMEKLLRVLALTDNEVGLLLAVQCVSQADAQPTKRKPTAELEYGSNKLKPKHGRTEKTKPSTSKNCDTENISQNSDTEAPPTKKLGVVVKRVRRSISHDSQKSGRTSDTKDAATSRPRRSAKRSDSVTPPVTNAITATRRSERSPVVPTHLKAFELSGKSTRKVKSPLSDNETAKYRDNVKIKTEAKNGNIAAKPSPNSELEGERAKSVLLKSLNALFDKPKPRKVEILLLDHMKESEVLETFNEYRADFDVFFKERKHLFQTDNYMTIGHQDVMDILTSGIRKKMMHKLRENYGKAGPHGSLIINGLLPLWIIRLFMDKYQLTREATIVQIKDQLKYSSYIKAENNEPIGSDLDD